MRHHPSKNIGISAFSFKKKEKRKKKKGKKKKEKIQQERPIYDYGLTTKIKEYLIQEDLLVPIGKSKATLDPPCWYWIIVIRNESL